MSSRGQRPRKTAHPTPHPLPLSPCGRGEGCPSADGLPTALPFREHGTAKPLRVALVEPVASSMPVSISFDGQPNCPSHLVCDRGVGFTSHSSLKGRLTVLVTCSLMASQKHGWPGPSGLFGYPSSVQNLGLAERISSKHQANNGERCANAQQQFPKRPVKRLLVRWSAGPT